MVIRTHQISTREGYALWAHSYDQEKNPLIMTEEPLVKALLDTLPVPGSVLDAATGTGRWALYLAERGSDVTAIDESEEMLAVARAKAEASGLAIKFENGRLEDLPFDTGTFDLVMCGLALCHLPDIRAGVVEFGRVLRPGGYLVVTDFHPQAIANGWQTTCIRGEEAYLLPNPGHSRAAYLTAIEAAGCQIKRVKDVLVREQPPGSYIVPDVDAFLADYGDWPMCLIVLAQKKGR